MYVGMPDKFFDDIIRDRYVLPAIELLSSEQIDKVVYMARGMAINVAVRAALLLEEVMGVMKKEIKIDSNPAPDRVPNARRGDEKGNNANEKGRRREPRLISEIEIAMQRF
nr:hypothetical protein [Candidatus Sigynarchaeota archaeon]